DETRGEILLERQRLLEQRDRIVQGVGSLRDAQLPEVLGSGAIGSRVVRGQERKARVGPAGSVRIDRVACELAESRRVLAEAVDVIGVGPDAGDDLGIAAWYRARGPAQRHDRARAAEGNVVEPAWRQAEMLGEADSRIRRQREACDAQPVDA